MLTITDDQLLDFARLGIRANAFVARKTPTPAEIEAAARATVQQAAFRAVVEAAAHFGWANAAPVPAAPRRKRAGPIAGQDPLFDDV